MAGHPWVFKRYGRSYLPVVASAEDLRAAADLDAALWLATVAPTAALRMDPALLHCVDADSDGRIRVGEFKDAIRWLFGRLTDASGVERGETTLRVEAVNTDDPQGRAIRDTLERIRAARPEPGAGEVPLAEIRAAIRALEARPAGSVGVIAPDAAPDPETRQYIEAILATTGGREAGGGRMGIGKDDLARFETAVSLYLEWHERGVLPPDQASAAIRPLGDDTERAVRVFERLRRKIDEYFTLSEAVALGERLSRDLRPAAPVSLPSLSAGEEEIRAALAGSPLAEPRADGRLDFTAPFNPFYEAEARRFREQVLAPLLSADATLLTSAEWQAIQRTFQPFIDWQTARAGAEVAALGVETLRARQEYGYAARVRGLIEESLSGGLALDHVRLAEKLALLQGGLLSLANQFVCCPDLYDPARRAAFEEGTLIMDGRRFNLAVRVFDRPEHVRSTEKGSMFVLYAQLEHAPSGRSTEVAVPVTAGAQGLLEVGKRGVFEDVEGTQWVARVVHLVDRPISLREALTEPFVRLGRAITGRIEAITTAAEKRMEQSGADAVTTVHESTSAPAAPPPQPAPGPGHMGGVLAGGGIAVAALGGSVAFMTRTFAGLRWWQLLGGFGGIMLAVLVPTFIVAAIRLRARDLSVLLEGGGWAINTRMRLTGAQRRQFTRRPCYPAGARLVRSGVRAWFWWALMATLAAYVLHGCTAGFGR